MIAAIAGAAMGGSRADQNGDDDEEEKECSIQSVKVWLKAFIPKDVPGLTLPRPNHPGETMVGGLPLVGDCFLTDQRGFSSDITASARIHSEIALDVKAGGLVLHEYNDCSPTHEVDCEDGDLDIVARGDSSRIYFFSIKAPAAGMVTFEMKGAAKNPCIEESADVDYQGAVAIVVWREPSEDGQEMEKARIDFQGFIDNFPAFEMYAAVNDGPGQQVFAVMPLPGNSPAALYGPPRRPVRGSVVINCQGQPSTGSPSWL
ncbi:DUF3238 domain-containing protein [Streptomyces sp. NPDC057445]|uniref:DUF3238 domain-containing protein n=1 Tax=Streptomyces sp. NPDC057445 TaxID=3346136 RepID=UPI0036B5D498